MAQAGAQLVELKDVDELKAVIGDSDKSPVILFKHSLTCPISAHAFREMNKFQAEGSDEGPIVGPIISPIIRMIVVQRSRSISDAVANQLGVRHESPQVILVRNGKAVWHASHYDITEESLHELLQSPQ
ncbi:MAG TPA: bacillithiol system redox-active protein YtxJ [Blastocatellia bacterium]|nr:bacillithiol system redox-active protein YtxJ [Blastocatellia bacterium]